MARRSSSLHLENRTWKIIDDFKEKEGLSSRNIALELILDRWSRGEGDSAPCKAQNNVSENEPITNTVTEEITTEGQETATEVIKPKIDLSSKMLGSIFDQLGDLD